MKKFYTGDLIILVAFFLISEKEKQVTVLKDRVKALHIHPIYKIIICTKILSTKGTQFTKQTKQIFINTLIFIVIVMMVD